MAIVVIEKSVQKYKITCTYPSCGSVLEFLHSDAEYYSIGREDGSVFGIACPCCHQILPLKNAEKIGYENR